MYKWKNQHYQNITAQNWVLRVLNPTQLNEHNLKDILLSSNTLIRNSQNYSCTIFRNLFKFTTSVKTRETCRCTTQHMYILPHIHTWLNFGN